MDTCIAIRTMLFKNGIVHLQAGGGIVYSVEEEEYIETINKLGGNIRAIVQAESKYSEIENRCSLTELRGEFHYNLQRGASKPKYIRVGP
jgi:hypothetical protein